MSEACRLCGSEKTKERFPGADLGLMKCCDCGVMFRPLTPGDDELSDSYREKYYLEEWKGSLGRFFREFKPEDHNKTSFFASQLDEFERMLGGPKRLLDVGCANGVFVWMARERGWDAEGVDPSRFAVEWGRRQFGVHLHQGSIHDVSAAPEFDAITLWDTIEHLPDPCQTLHACRPRLAPGGVLAVLTPDSNSLVNQLVHAAYKVSPKRSAPLLDKLYHPDHLTCFDRDSLARAIIEQEFQLQWIQGYDEAPEDTETGGMMRAAVAVARVAARLIRREHELLVWARKPGEKKGG